MRFIVNQKGCCRKLFIRQKEIRILSLSGHSKKKFAKKKFAKGCVKKIVKGCVKLSESDFKIRFGTLDARGEIGYQSLEN